MMKGYYRKEDLTPEQIEEIREELNYSIEMSELKELERQYLRTYFVTP